MNVLNQFVSVFQGEAKLDLLHICFFLFSTLFIVVPFPMHCSGAQSWSRTVIRAFCGKTSCSTWSYCAGYFSIRHLRSAVMPRYLVTLNPP